MTKEFFAYLAAMALVTYAIRMIPFTVMRSKIKSKFIRNFLEWSINILLQNYVKNLG